MQNHLTDLDELLENIRDARSQEYISEAIRCYRAGAYRSAIITTWVAVCIDIIEKIKELSNEGDKGAKPLKQKFDKLTENNKTSLLEQEKFLLKYAYNDLAIITNNESKLLQRIKDDRNLCAHPNFLDDGQSIQITAEVARYHIVSACNALLYHPPIRGKILIEKIQKIVAEKSFPTNPEKALDMLKSEHYLDNAQDSVFRNLTIVFLKQIFQGNRSLEIKAPRLSSALQAISELNPDIYKKTLKEILGAQLSNMTDARLKRVFLLPYLWSHIEAPIQKKIIGLIPTLSVDDIIKYKLNFSAESVFAINTALIKKVKQFNHPEKIQIIECYPIKEFKGIAIDIFINSYSFAGAYTNGRDCLLPLAQYFDAKNLKEILDGTLRNSRWRINQILNAGGMNEIFSSLFNETKQNIPEYSDIWSEFWNAISSHYANNFPTLSELLIEEQIIQVAPVEPVEPDDDT